MKKLAPLLALFLALPALAGTMDVGGGAGVVCPGWFGWIKSVELLDLYEGRQRGLDIPAIRIDEKKQFEAMAARLNVFADFTMHWPGLATDAKPGDEGFIPKGDFDLHGARAKLELSKALTKRGRELVLPGDLGLERAIELPRGCKLESIGYVEEGRLKITTDLYERLDETNRAAFWMHEAIYKIARSFKETDLRKGTGDVRKLVAGLFARNTGLADLVQLYSPLADGRSKFLLESLSVTIGSIPLYRHAAGTRLFFVPFPREFQRVEATVRASCKDECKDLSEDEKNAHIDKQTKETMAALINCIAETGPAAESDFYSHFEDLDIFTDNTSQEQAREWFPMTEAVGSIPGFELDSRCIQPTTRANLLISGRLYLLEREERNGLKSQLKLIAELSEADRYLQMILLDFLLDPSKVRETYGRPSAPAAIEAGARYPENLR